MKNRGLKGVSHPRAVKSWRKRGTVDREVSQHVQYWSQSLQRVQADLATPAGESIDHFTLEDLKVEIITFGKTHVGQTYEQVWESSPEWIKWFLEHFSNSSKMAHRKVIRYIRMKIEEMETEQGMPSQTPVLRKAKAKSLPQSLAAKAKSRPGPDLTRSDRRWQSSLKDIHG